MAKGYNEIIEISDSVYRFPKNNVVLSVYDYPATIVDSTILGTPAVSTDGTEIVGQLLRDKIGRYLIESIRPGLYTVVATGGGITPQVLVGYEKMEVTWGHDITGSDIPYKDNTNVSIATKIAQLEATIALL